MRVQGKDSSDSSLVARFPTDYSRVLLLIYIATVIVILSVKLALLSQVRSKDYSNRLLPMNRCMFQISRHSGGYQ